MITFREHPNGGLSGEYDAHPVLIPASPKLLHPSLPIGSAFVAHRKAVAAGRNEDVIPLPKPDWAALLRMRREYMDIGTAPRCTGLQIENLDSYIGR